MSDTIGAITPDPFGPTFYLNGYFGDAPGWKDPSYQADLYYPWHVVPGRSVVFGVVQGAITNFATGYVNTGLGYRQYNEDWNRIFGAWGFFDYDNSQAHQFSREGVTLESLGQYFDLRANWYFLNNQGAHIISDQIGDVPFFQGYNIVVNRSTATETGFDGGDFELGGPLPFLGRYGVSGYVGPYYLHSDAGGHTVGVEGRLNCQVTNNFQVNVTMQNDQIFNTTTFVSVSLQLPDGTPTQWFKPLSVRERLNSMVIRKDRIPVLDQVDVSQIPLLNPPNTPGQEPNPRADLPIFVIHVDPNLAAGTGNGTVEHPFGSLEQARVINNPSIDIFDIRPRVDATGTNLVMNGSFSLFDYQRVWGTTIPHNLPTAGGVLVVPATDAGLALPLVSNGAITAGGAVFQLANNNEISGLNISAANASSTVFGTGISNNGGPIVNFNINNNQFTNYLNAVSLFNATGVGAFTNNVITGTAGIAQNGFEVINFNPGLLALDVSGNSSTGNIGPGFLVSTSVAGATIDSTFTNNSSTTNGTGYQFTTAPGTQNIDFEDNIASGNTATSTGVHFEADGGTINVNSFVDNTVTGNAGNGVWIDANNNAGGGTINVMNFQGNTITGNGTAPVGPLGADPDGVLISAIGLTSFVNAQIGVLGGAPNNISNNGSVGIGGAGVHLFVNNGGTIGASATLPSSIVNNEISSNVSFGINVDALSGQIGLIGASPTMAGAIPLLISNNNILGNGDAGIFARLQNASTAGLTITQNSITGQVDGPSTFAAGEGIHLRTEGASFLWQAFINNNFIGVTSTGSASGNASHGIEIEAIGNSMISNTTLFPGLPLVQILNNTIEFNGGDGVNFQRQGDATFNNILIQGNTITNNTGNGINLFLSGGSLDVSQMPPAPLVMDFTIQNNNLSNNGQSGANFFSTADAPLRILFQNNIASNNGLDGITAETQFFSQIEGTWQNNTITNNGRFGIGFIDADSAFASFTVAVQNNTIESNLSDGINYSSFETISLGGGTSNITIENNLIKKNGGDGINIQPTGTAVADFTIENNQIIFNTGDGIFMQANKFGIINATVNDNTIQHNGGDGVALFTQAGLDPTTADPGLANLGNGTINATLQDNNISFNALHGINILNQWSGQMNIDITGTVNPNTTTSPLQDTNVIDLNGLDGILITNFVDPTLAQQRPLTAPWNDFFLPGNNLNVTVHQTEISGNGVNAQVPDDGDGILINVGTSQNGAVTASLTNNHFSGNRNIDIVTQSFVATAQPAVQPLFVSGLLNLSFQPDPIARLNLTLTGNVGDTIDVTRVGAFYGGPNQPADVFKTIFGSWNDPSVTGLAYTFVNPTVPTLTQNRRRNAQRDTVVDVLSTSGSWPTATAASPTSPNSVGATPAPTATTVAASVPFIGTNNDYANALITFNGPGFFGTFQITATNNTNQTITFANPGSAIPPAGTSFFITAPFQAGVGVPTFVTNSGPSVNTFNTFKDVVSDFGTQVTFPGFLNPGEAQFTYTWSFAAPGTAPAGSLPAGLQPFPQGPGPNGVRQGFPFAPPPF